MNCTGFYFNGRECNEDKKKLFEVALLPELLGRWYSHPYEHDNQSSEATAIKANFATANKESMV